MGGVLANGRPTTFSSRRIMDQGENEAKTDAKIRT